MDKKERLTLNIPECAKLLGISRGSAYELAAQGKLPVLYLGRLHPTSIGHFDNADTSVCPLPSLQA